MEREPEERVAEADSGRTYEPPAMIVLGQVTDLTGGLAHSQV